MHTSRKSRRLSKPTNIPVNRFISEGNPNTQQKIKEETGSKVPEVPEGVPKDGKKNDLE